MDSSSSSSLCLSSLLFYVFFFPHHLFLFLLFVIPCSCPSLHSTLSSLFLRRPFIFHFVFTTFLLLRLLSDSLPPSLIFLVYLSSSSTIPFITSRTLSLLLHSSFVCFFLLTTLDLCLSVSSVYTLFGLSLAFLWLISSPSLPFSFLLSSFGKAFFIILSFLLFSFSSYLVYGPSSSSTSNIILLTVSFISWPGFSNSAHAPSHTRPRQGVSSFINCMHSLSSLSKRLVWSDPLSLWMLGVTWIESEIINCWSPLLP